MKSVLIEHGYNAFLALFLTAHRQLWNQLSTIVCLSRYDLMIFKKTAYFFSKLANHLCSLVPFNVKKKKWKPSTINKRSEIWTDAKLNVHSWNWSLKSVLARLIIIWICKSFFERRWVSIDWWKYVRREFPSCSPHTELFAETLMRRDRRHRQYRQHRNV